MDLTNQKGCPVQTQDFSSPWCPEVTSISLAPSAPRVATGPSGGLRPPLYAQPSPRSMTKGENRRPTSCSHWTEHIPISLPADVIMCPLFAASLGLA